MFPFTNLDVVKEETFGFNTHLYTWVCPECGSEVEVMINDDDFATLGIDKLREIIKSFNSAKLKSRHECKLIPIKYVVKGKEYNGIYSRK